MARSIEDPGQRVEALVFVAGELVQAGRVQEAAGLAAEAAQIATRIKKSLNSAGRIGRVVGGWLSQPRRSPPPR